MRALVGILVVAGAVYGGYVMEGGHMLVLNQPAEFVIKGGAALVATFLAILLSHGFLQPLASNMEHRNALEQLKGQPEPITL